MNKSASILNTSSLSETDGRTEDMKNNTVTEGIKVEILPNSGNTTTDIKSFNSSNGENTIHSQRKLLEAKNSGGSNDDILNMKEDVQQSQNLENEDGLEEEADSSFDLFRNREDLPDEYNYDYDDYVDDSMWGDEEWTEGRHEKLEDYVDVDAHILSTPVSLSV